MTAVSYGELESLDCELLPPRVLLSLVDLGFDGPGHATPGSDSPTPEGGGQGDTNTTVSYACQATTTQGTGGLIGALGLGQPPSSTITCVPAAVTSN
ncbi:hypothetical protein HUT18_28790 [Streptomyces sp. NA04227]|uniref:hypothetical protein n=1 Tax=Streptomyces sp. NA04227 TaxID=2742136 RepID=UPI00158FD0AE|nr:hypothetical protein [Streptomyces sp. NA04227]QKW09814.1 hypothetical protein HUT18_28790 [Streptomyces sp. NA04227]